MRTAAIIGPALVALLCGAALLYAGVMDASDGKAQAMLPIVIGVVLVVGGLLFLYKGFKR